MTCQLPSPEYSHFMDEAMREARLAAESGEIPIGAVAVRGTVIIARAHNRVEQMHDATCHAEMELIRRCSEIRGDWRMDDIDIYVTKEPCAMCAGAMVNARVRSVVYGVSDPRSGACGSALNLLDYPGMLWRVRAHGGIRSDEAQSLLRSFFNMIRLKKRQP